MCLRRLPVDAIRATKAKTAGSAWLAAVADTPARPLQYRVPQVLVTPPEIVIIGVENDASLVSALRGCSIVILVFLDIFRRDCDLAFLTVSLFVATLLVKGVVERVALT